MPNKIKKMSSKVKAQKVPSTTSGNPFEKFEKIPADLESKLLREIEADERDKKINDAKFRAINQGTSSYEEFRQIVLAAELSPLSKDDKESLHGPRTIWNAIKVEPHSTSAPGGITSTQKYEFSTSVPKTFNEFKNLWKVTKESKQRWEILCNVDTTQKYFDVFLEDIPADLFSDVIKSIYENCVFEDKNCQRNKEVTLNWLKCFQKCKRPQIVLCFLSKEDKEILRSVLGYVENANLETTEKNVDEILSLTSAYKNILENR